MFIKFTTKNFLINFWNVRPIVSSITFILVLWADITSACFISLEHSHKKRKDTLETRAVLLIFSLELEISGVAIQSIHQNIEKRWLLWGITQWKLLWGFFSRFLLFWLWCQGFWFSSEDRYRSKWVSQILFMCYNLLNSQNISINQ